MRIRKHILATAGLIILTTISANAQKVALKTNLLYDATTTVVLTPAGEPQLCCRS